MNRRYIAISYNCLNFCYVSSKLDWITCHYNPLVRIIDLVSHATYVVCVNFMHNWLDLQFKVDSERQIFWETFNGNFIYFSEFLPEICWKEIAEEILYIFRFDVWPGTRTFSANKPTHYLLDHGDFKVSLVEYIYCLLMFYIIDIYCLNFRHY